MDLESWKKNLINNVFIIMNSQICFLKKFTDNFIENFNSW